MDLSTDKLRARFAELTKKYESQDAKRAPIQQERDKYMEGVGKKLAAFDDRIRKANKGLYEIEMERAVISRALGGKTAE
jgi:hypothetical protein